MVCYKSLTIILQHHRGHEAIHADQPRLAATTAALAGEALGQAENMEDITTPHDCCVSIQPIFAISMNPSGPSEKLSLVEGSNHVFLLRTNS